MNNYNQHIFANEKYICLFCSIKIHVSGFDKFLESIFCLLLAVKVSSLQKILEISSGSQLARGQVNMTDEAKLCCTICLTFEAFFVPCVVSQVLLWKRIGLSVDQCWLQSLQFLMHLINLLSTFLRCNGFAGIQKAVENQISSGPPNNDQDHLFDAGVALGSALELLLRPATELVIAGCCIKSTFGCTSQSNREMVHFYCIEKEKMTLQNDFFDFRSAHKTPIYRTFSSFHFASNAE